MHWLKVADDKLLAGRGYESFEVALLGALKLLRKLEFPIEISVRRLLKFGAHWFELAPKERLPKISSVFVARFSKPWRERQVRLAPGCVAPFEDADRFAGDLRQITRAKRNQR